MNDRDKLHRFLFDRSDIRGEIVTLSDSYQSVLDKADYPPIVQKLLGEFLAAAGLLSATLKFDGILTIQARGDGPLGLIVADCTRKQNLRGVARFEDAANLNSDDLRQLIGNGHLAITIEPTRGERYQGIVPLEHATFSRCLESWFEQSEQLPTRIWLNANGNHAAGLLLQAMPPKTMPPNTEANSEYCESQWEHLTRLAETIKADEQLNLDHRDQLYRLFHQEELRLFEPTDLKFACSCSYERTASMLRSMQRQELEELLEERGVVEINCQFCLTSYPFDDDEIRKLFDGEPPVLH